MYLKSLEMQGFKSFPDKTKLVFENAEFVEVKDGIPHGVTVIVGPNGSGKSNIADAMRWVLGEISSKSLRGSKMEDVIFGGADSRRPMGYAEVSVTFDNRGDFGKLDCPYDEVTVTRRYYRAGESEYFINRKGVRLRDIYELFMNTGIGRDGYSIIGQGRIAEMVSRKSEERRSVFEDASGIAKYRYRKSEAERKLEQTEDNMNRVNDIYSEVSAQVGPLEKEAERAKKALALMEDKKKADVSLWLYDTEKLREEMNDAETLFRHAKYDLDNADDAIKTLEVQNQKLFEASQGSKQESEELLAEIQKKTEELHQLDSDYKVAENTISHANDMIATTEGGMTAINRQMEEELATAKKHTENRIRLLSEKAEQEAKQDTLSEEQKALSVKETEAGEKVAKALEDIREAEKEAVDVRVRITMLEKNRENDNGKNESALTELNGYRAEDEKLSLALSDKEKTVADYQNEMNAIDEKITEWEKQTTETDRQLTLKREEKNQTLFRRDSVRQRIATIKAMEEHFEGYSEAVRFVMESYAKGNITDKNGTPCGKIYGPVSQLISVEDKFLVAVEIALGNGLQHIVTEDEATAKSAMFALKKAEAGRTTFYPLTSVQGQDETKEMKEASGFEGYIGVADTLVSADKKYRNVLSSLLGRTLVFDNIEHASVMAKAVGYRVKAVTLDGQQINVGGSFTGGSVKTGKGVLSRAGEIKRLEENLSQEEKRLASLQSEEKKLADALQEQTDEKNGEEDRKEILRVMLNTEQAQLEQLLAKKDANRSLLSKLADDLKNYESERENREEEIRRLQTEEKALQEKCRELTAYRQKIYQEHGDIQLRIEEIGRELTKLYIAVSEKAKDAETAEMLKIDSENRLEKLRGDLTTSEGKINTQKELIRVTEERMQSNRSAYKTADEQLETLNQKRKETEAGSADLELRLNAITQKLRDRMNQKELVFREYTKAENKLVLLRERQDKLSGQLWEEYELTRNQAQELNYPPVTKENRSEMMLLQTECKNKLRVMGNVDLDAVNKYIEVKQRYDYYSVQLNDLTKAKDELNGIIADLEKDMKEAFVDSFNKINENFGRVFAELFGGGSAEITLTDPDNVLESGIEIKAAPPGKIIKNLMQLSGGEQAFIGVALFFAILQVNPTSFCILDEIEAALDEVNVERLAQYIKRYSFGTQFIMITHRRGTMAAADRLYGVTMPEHGISKVLMLDVADVSKKEGDDWNGIFG